MKTIYRQGNVLLVRVAAVPPGAQPCVGRTILAEGEATGHLRTYL